MTHARAPKVQFGLRIAPLRSGGFEQFSLVRTQIMGVVVTGVWAGPARLQLPARVMVPPADLSVLEVVDATHVLTDLTLSSFEEVHDYLAHGQPPRTIPGAGVGSWPAGLEPGAAVVGSN